MAISLAQAPVSASSSGPISTTAVGPTGSSTTAGNSLLLLVRLASNTNDVTSISDTQSNTYARIADFASGSSPTERYLIFVASNIVGGGTTSATLNFNTGLSMTARLYEWSGLVASNATVLDVATSGDNATGTLLTSSSLSLNYSEELVVAIGSNSSSATVTVGTGYGHFLETTVGIRHTGFEDRTVTGGGSVTASLNFGSSVAGNILTAALKGSAATLVGTTPVNFVKVPTIMVMR